MLTSWHGEGNSLVTGEFPTQRAINVENVPISWRRHADGHIRVRHLVTLVRGDFMFSVRFRRWVRVRVRVHWNWCCSHLDDLSFSIPNKSSLEYVLHCPDDFKPIYMLYDYYTWTTSINLIKHIGILLIVLILNQRSFYTSDYGKQ